MSFLPNRLRSNMVILLAICWSTWAFAQRAGNTHQERKRADHAKTPLLRNLAPLPETEGHRDKPLKLLPPAGSIAGAPSGALQSTATRSAPIGSPFSFNGLGIGGDYTPNAAPPDTNGSVGATQYVQWVNESFAVYDKATGNRIYGPAAGNTLFQALGSSHPCAVHNDGDPIAQYDKAAQRWVLTQFSVRNGAIDDFWQCVAVSTTSDATGSYNVYAFDYGNVDFNDYPKLAVWSDNYYITFNIFANGQAFSGSKLCAYDRSAMLVGNDANQVCFQLSPSFGGLLPADIDGSNPPPAGSPEYFLNIGNNSLNIWQMSNVDFAAGTAVLSGPINLPAAPFSRACNGGTCIPQVGTSQLLDSLGDRLMYRLAYRNFHDHESLVLNHSVTANSSVGIRWYEIRDPRNAPVIYQQGTYAPDNSYRWMASAAMDATGNLAVGYSVSDSTIHPGIRFAGRTPNDPLGTLSSEITLKDGAGSQLTGLRRWGDYSNLSIDPVDDCTMWYTTEYLQADGRFNWSTRIANFRFSTCGTPDYSLAADPASSTVLAGQSTDYNLAITPVNGFSGTVDLSVTGLPDGAVATFDPQSIAGSGSAKMTVSTDAAATGTYPLVIAGNSGALTHTTTVTLIIQPASDYSLIVSPSSQTIAAGESTRFDATVTFSGGFSGSVGLSVSGLPDGTAATFVPDSLAASGHSILTISTDDGLIAPGDYPLSITASSDTTTQSTEVTLTISAPQAAKESVRRKGAAVLR